MGNSDSAVTAWVVQAGSLLQAMGFGLCTVTRGISCFFSFYES